LLPSTLRKREFAADEPVLAQEQASLYDAQR